jgi:hypothetical protein
MDTSTTPAEAPEGIEPHLYFGDDWRKYPSHRWFIGTAWHYTSVQGCFGIVANHELWATSASMLNDVGEMFYGVERVRTFVENWMPRSDADSRAEQLLRSCVTDLDRTLLENPIFVLSASKSPDLLNQWANYGESSGCALGFDASGTLIHEGMVGDFSAPSALPLWLEVLYDVRAQDEYIGTIFDDLVAPTGLLTQAIVHDADPMLLAKQNLSMLIASLKHPGFQAENEVRFITVRGQGSKVRYRPTSRGVVPFVKLFGTTRNETDGVVYSTDAAEKIRLPITEVHVGPPQGASEVRRVASMRDFLIANGYDVHVQGAGLPYLP